MNLFENWELFDLRGFVRIGDEIQIAQYPREYHKEIIARVNNGGYGFKGPEQENDEINRKIFNELLDLHTEQKDYIDLGLVCRIFGKSGITTVEISKNSVFFDYPNLRDPSLPTIRNKTLECFRKNYPKTKFVIAK